MQPPDIPADYITTPFRSFGLEEFLEWPAWQRLQRMLRSNGGSYGLSGPRGAGKTWLMLRAIESVEAGDHGQQPGIGLWYPSPSEYDSLAFLASLSDSFATRIERWYRLDPSVRRRTTFGWTIVALLGTAGALTAAALVGWRSTFEAAMLILTVGLITSLTACGAVVAWRANWPERRLEREAIVVRERARYSATQRRKSEIGGEGGRGLVATAKRATERELVERPATLSSLVNDFRALAAQAGETTGGVVIAIDELDKMSDPDGVRRLLRDIKAIFEVPRVYFLVSVSDEAARNLSLGPLKDRNEFNSSFYAVVRAQPATPADCAELLERRGGVPREVALVLAVMAGGNPREVVRMAEIAGAATTARQAAMAVLGDEAATLRTDIVTATHAEGVPDLGQAAREAAFLQLANEVFEQPDAFDRLCADAISAAIWQPAWGDPGWSARFEEPWRRLMVRLAVAGRIATVRSVLRETDLTDRLFDVMVAVGQSSHVAKILLERKLRLDTRRPTIETESRGVRPRLKELAAEYESTRGSMKAGAGRTSAMDHIVQEARRLAPGADLGTEEVVQMLRSEHAGERVVGLAVVQATADPQAFPSVMSMVENPRTPFEQYHALRALESLRSEFTTEQRAQVHRILTEPTWRDGLRNDSSRVALADRIISGASAIISQPKQVIRTTEKA
jgi:hypothetical protein